jgi:hypothetical protein
MRMLGMGTASPSNSLSSPAMMRRRLDLPEPFKPSTPILAPGKNESEMSLRMTRLWRHDLAHAIHRVNVLSHGSLKPVVVRAAIIAGVSRWTAFASRPHRQKDRAGARPWAAAAACAVLLLGGSGYGDDGRAAVLARGAALRGRLGCDELPPALLVRVVLGGDHARFARFSGDELALARELGVDAFELAVEHRNRRLALQFDLLRLDVDLALACSCSLNACDDRMTLLMVCSERFRARSISASLVYEDTSARSAPGRSLPAARAASFARSTSCSIAAPLLRRERLVRSPDR